MGRTATVILWVLVMVAVNVALDVLFLMHLFWLRPMVNVGVVLVSRRYTPGSGVDFELSRAARQRDA